MGHKYCISSIFTRSQHEQDTGNYVLTCIAGILFKQKMAQESQEGTATYM